MPIWECNSKYYLKIIAVKLKEVKVKSGFNKYHPYVHYG